MKELKDLKIKDASKVNELTEAKLKVEIKDSEKKLFTLRMKKELWELKQTHLIKFLRKYIAKLKTTAVSKGFNIG